jgi:hypothetical protein
MSMSHTAVQEGQRSKERAKVSQVECHQEAEKNEQYWLKKEIIVPNENEDSLRGIAFIFCLS